MTGFNSKLKNNIAIRLSNVSKKYLVHHEKPTLAERILHGKNEEFWALRHLNIEVKNGERIGLIGSNGSGKTTLLKIIAGISSPTEGKVTIHGKVVSLIDLQAGFHPDLTGLQNIYLNGSILGMSKKEIDYKLKDIVDFADIGKFIDTQIFTYSSGMLLRLGFSVAIHTNPDILILDENISVGDQEFRNKSFEKIKELFKAKKTVIIASHDLDLINKYCDKIFWLEKGKIHKNDRTKPVITSYLQSQTFLDK
jgi:ABC-type polysaccharide/polyol phosphate transport system ATPase subunit